MAYTTSDILGKGFKFEQVIDVQKINQISIGTIGALAGGANWGPVNEPTFIGGQSFQALFGNPLLKADGADYSGITAEYYLKNSPYLWYTRVADGTDKKSRLAITRQAQPAKISGVNDLRNTNYVINATNNKLSIGVNTGSGFSDTEVTLSDTASASPIDSVTTLPAVAASNDAAVLAWNFQIGSDYINFFIDDLEYRYVIKEEATTDLDEPDFLRLIVPATGTDADALGYTPGAYDGITTNWDEYTPDASVDNYAKRLAFALKKYVVVPALVASGMTQGNAATLADSLITVDANSISIESNLQGNASSILVYNFSKAFPTASPEDPLTSYSTNTSIETILSEINEEIEDDALAWLNAATGVLTIGTVGVGTSFEIRLNTIAANAYTILGVTDTLESAGVAAISNGGTFTAKYTGKSGNEIKLRLFQADVGTVMEVYFQNFFVGSVMNFSYDVSAANYFGTLFNRHPEISRVVTFTTPTGVGTLPEFSMGDILLTGGTSGVANLADLDYIRAIEEYKNIDLYQFDVISIPGIMSTAVMEKLQEVCEYRRDAFAIVDIPETKAGLPQLGGNIYSAIDWHNAAAGSGNTFQLASKFVSTYFPWVSINDVNGINWYPASTRVMGAIAQSDKQAGHKYAAPAGPNRATITDIEGLAIYLREDEKNRLYADELGNAINPIVFDKSRGFFIDGQKNTDRDFGAISRLNVLRTALAIKRRVYNIAPDFFWQPLTGSLMEEFQEVLTQMMETFVAASAIKEEFTVTCDANINSAAIEAQRGLIAVIEWTPIRSIEKIKVVSVLRDMQVNVTIG